MARTVRAVAQGSTPCLGVLFLVTSTRARRKLDLLVIFIIT